MVQNGRRIQCVVKIPIRQGLNYFILFSYLYISYNTINLIYIRCLQNVRATPQLSYCTVQSVNYLKYIRVVRNIRVIRNTFELLEKIGLPETVRASARLGLARFNCDAGILDRNVIFLLINNTFIDLRKESILVLIE